jgi:hypothetical protein
VNASEISRKYGTERNPISMWAAIRYVRDLKRNKPATLQAIKAEVWKVTPAQLEAIGLETSTGFLTQVRNQFSKLLRIQDGAIERGDNGTTINAACEVARLLQMIGQAVKEPQSGPMAVNVALTNNTLVVSPAYHDMRKVLLDALRKHPDARADVL